jgi:hypothetical protein
MPLVDPVTSAVLPLSMKFSCAIGATIRISAARGLLSNPEIMGRLLGAKLS